jgi:hypothetical protein
MRTTGPGQPELILLDVMDVLDQLGIPCALVGAFAVSYYGVPRATTDADCMAWMNDTGKSADDLKSQLLASGYRAELRQGDADDPIRQSIRIEDAYENRVDLLLGVRGMDPNAIHRCVPAHIADAFPRVIGPEDLIGMKLFAGGPQDMIDVRGILQVSRDRLNLDLLHHVTRLYGTDVVQKLDALLEEFPLIS